jgi:1-acyl-sn-glycerol-3-phosphate acyltransferase
LTEFGSDETMRDRWLRRAVTVPTFLLTGGFALLLCPGLVFLAAVVDTVRGERRFVLCRTVLGLTLYLTCEAAGIVGSGLLWLLRFGMTPQQFTDWNYALQRVWARALIGGAQRIFALRFEIEGVDEIGPGPIIVFMRHVSTIDTLLPAAFLAERHGLRLRYVMKRELLWDPCLDIVGHRLPNVFIRRASPDRNREIALIRKLAATLGSGEGILIYPEGTRFTAEKRSRVLARMAESRRREEVERATDLRHVLPPRVAGPLALLESRPDADVLFLAHCGFERAASLNDLWAGALVGTTVRLKLWRVPGDKVPRTTDERVQWLHREWMRIDEWIDLTLLASATPGTST